MTIEKHAVLDLIQNEMLHYLDPEQRKHSNHLHCQNVFYASKHATVIPCIYM